MISTGKGAPPDMQVLIEVRSKLPGFGWFTMAVYMVGTPGNSVGFFFVMSWSTGSSSKRGRMTMEPPMAMVKFITTVIANT